MKKKILIFSHALELGGAERSLIGLLNAIDPAVCDVDLFLMRHEGELMGMIPDYVHLLSQSPAYTVLARPMKNTLKEGHLLLTAARLAGKICAGHYVKKHHHTDSSVTLDYSHKFTCPFMPKVQPDTEYDLAISFLTPHYFVAQKVRAKKKIAWIHTDYTRVQVDIHSETTMWGAFDYIASISPAVTDNFLRIFPSLADKIVLIENILPMELIRKQAEEPAIGMDFDGIKLLSIGRFCTAKNFDNIPDICSKLVDSGLNIRWYLIGFGGDEVLIRQKIEEAEMTDHVIMLGKKDNPYPYFKACDLYVQPSRYEGKCVTVREAQALGKPVVITNYATASSQLEDGVDGIIAPMDNEHCAETIGALLKDSAQLKKLIKGCRQHDYSNAREVEKLYCMMEN